MGDENPAASTGSDRLHAVWWAYLQCDGVVGARMMDEGEFTKGRGRERAVGRGEVEVSPCLMALKQLRMIAHLQAGWAGKQAIMGG